MNLQKEIPINKLFRLLVKYFKEINFQEMLQIIDNYLYRFDG